MADYRLYLLNDAGHIRSRIDLLDIDTDTDAIREAEAQRQGEAGELWERGRIVKRFKAD